MTLVSPSQSNPGDEVTASAINTPVNEIAAVVNGNIDDTNISGVSGSKIANSTITYAKLDFPLSLGYAQITSDFVFATSTATQVTGLSASVTIPAGSRRIKITAYLGRVELNAGAGTAISEIWDGTVGSGTKLASSWASYGSTGYAVNVTAIAVVTPAAGSKTYNVSIKNSGGSSTTIKASATEPAFILVEAI